VSEEDRILVADLLNEIFHLPINWDLLPSPDGCDRVSKLDVLRLEQLLRRLSPKLRDPRLLELIWVVSQIRKERICRPVGDFVTDDQTREAQQRLRDTVDHRGDVDDHFRQLYEQIASMLGRQSDRSLFEWKKDRDGNFSIERLSGPPEADFESQMDDFFRAEEAVLRAAGLDQASTGIIILYLRSKCRAIVENLRKQRMLYTKRYEKSIDSLTNDTTRVLGMREKRGAISTKMLRRTKNKIVGLATIWADVIPLATARDWGMAGVWSCVAGATVASIMPGK
jgi:hypothetical protein